MKEHGITTRKTTARKKYVLVHNFGRGISWKALTWETGVKLGNIIKTDLRKLCYKDMKRLRIVSRGEFLY
jgi:hypothetical protein